MRHSPQSSVVSSISPSESKVHCSNPHNNLADRAGWTRAGAIEMVYAGNQFCLGAPLREPSSPNFFTWQRLPVESVSPSAIVLSPTALAHITLVPKQAKLGLPCWVENVF